MHPHRTALIVLSCAFVCAAGPLRAAELSRKLSASDEFQIQVPADPQISPDGKRVVYVRQLADSMTDQHYFNLWIVGSDGLDHRPLTSGREYDSSPRWSPDGTRLAYISTAGGTAQIYLRWIDSGQTARLTSLDTAPANISWSPDGKYLSFSSFVPEQGPQIAQLPSPPPGAKWGDPPMAYNRLAYRAAGYPGSYLRPGFRQIFVVSSDGGAVRQVTSGDSPNGTNTAVWSPDGKYLIVSANRHPESDHEYLDSEIYEVAVADGSLRALTHRYGPDATPALSPDGRWIAYTGFDDRHQTHQTTKLYLMNRDGSGSHSLSDALDRDIQSPQWAPDNSGVFFLYDDQGVTCLGFYSLNGKFAKITDHIASALYNWGSYGGGSFSVSRSGAIALTRGTVNDPGDVAVWSRAAVHTVTALNQELLMLKPPGRVETIWYESSKDKRKIEGWILYPPDFDPAKKYPLLLEIHGGPMANYGERFDFEKQVWAAMGYVILFVNPRGSTSYGEEFANLIHHAFPGDEFFDLNSGVDAILARGFIDPNNLFVEGGSGGGTLTCWMIEHTDRFRAAASLYPAINWYSFALTSDIPIESQYWFSGNPWDNTEQYMQLSPISRVAKVKTPTLLMTGETDYRTPIGEAEQFYRALKLLNVETVLVRVPDEGHQIVYRPSHHMAKMLYVAGWFDQHKAKP
jgi:dipeptidyl aminopeptidase/acylaminoacyl peptidase